MGHEAARIGHAKAGDDAAHAGGALLDGEVGAPDNATLPSGDGVAGGVFELRFDALPGDATQNREVDIFDTLGVRNRGFENVGPPPTDSYAAVFDLNGSGDISAADTLEARNRAFTSLPEVSPAPLPSAAGDMDVLKLTSAAAGNHRMSRDIRGTTRPRHGVPDRRIPSINGEWIRNDEGDGERIAKFGSMLDLPSSFDLQIPL